MTLKRGLLMLIVAAMLADLGTFYGMQNLVWIEAQEQNPVMQWMYVNVGGVFGVALLKAVLTGAILVLVSRLERRWMLVSASGLAIFFGLLGASGNVSMWLR
jgi:hypothetical protein